MLNQKAVAQIFIVLGVLLLTSIIGGYYYFNVPKNQSENDLIMHVNPSFTPTPSPSIDTNNWKTYTDVDGKYSIQYPSGFGIHINEAHAFETNNYQPSKNHVEFESRDADVNPYITIDYKNISPSETLNQFITQEYSCDNSKKEMTKLDGIDAEIFKESTCGLTGGTILFAIHNLKGYAISFNSSHQLDESFINQMLSTFKFTDSSSPLPSPSRQKVCQSDSDCSSDEYCTQAGPIIQGQQNQKSCYKKGTAVPL